MEGISLRKNGSRYVIVQMAGNPREGVRQGVRRSGSAARRSRSGSVRDHVRGPTEDDSAQRLFRAALPQGADDISVKCQVRGNRCWLFS